MKTMATVLGGGDGLLRFTSLRHCALAPHGFTMRAVTSCYQTTEPTRRPDPSVINPPSFSERPQPCVASHARIVSEASPPSPTNSLGCETTPKPP
jgi:hypothetical protein